MSNGWDILKSVVTKAAPILAGALIPGSGGLAASIISSLIGEPADNPAAMAAKLQAADPSIWAELRKAELQHQAELAHIAAELDIQQLAADTARIQAVNQTMQAEAQSEHWPQWSWRPFNGYLYGITVFFVYVILPLADKTIPAVPEFVWIGWGAILGVTAWHRGKQKRHQAGEQQPGILAALTQRLTPGAQRPGATP